MSLINLFYVFYAHFYFTLFRYMRRHVLENDKRIQVKEFSYHSRTWICLTGIILRVCAIMYTFMYIYLWWCLTVF
jgi:hypothetical protein